MMRGWVRLGRCSLEREGKPEDPLCALRGSAWDLSLGSPRARHAISRWASFVTTWADSRRGWQACSTAWG